MASPKLKNLYLSLKNSPWRASGGLLEPFLPWTWDKKRKERIWEICQVMQLEDLKDTLVLTCPTDSSGSWSWAWRSSAQAQWTGAQNR